MSDISDYVGLAPDDPTKWDDEMLELHIMRVRESAKNYRAAAQKADDLANQYQAVLGRRALEAYWAANPHLIRLEVGDKLAITQEFIDYIEAEVKQGYHYHVGDVWVVKDLYAKECHIEKDEFMGRQVNLPLAYASDMRRAYLESQVAHE